MERIERELQDVLLGTKDLGATNPDVYYTSSSRLSTLVFTSTIRL